MSDSVQPNLFEYPPTPPGRGTTGVKPIAREDRPIYRYHACGPEALSTAELLALTLGGADGLDLGSELLAVFGSIHALARASHARLTRIAGIGEAQAAKLRAVLELSRRLQLPPAEERYRITCPTDAATLLTPAMSHLEQEELRVVLLDTRSWVLGVETIYRGSLNTAVIRVAELFRPAIERQAAAILVAHNHPSSDPSPSPEDVSVTKEIFRAGKLLSIDLLDHLIIGGSKFVSLKERGLGFDG